MNRALFRLEAAKRPSGHESEQQKGDWGPDQKHRYREQFGGGMKSALNSVKDQIDDPPHHPGSRYQQPDAPQPALPIYLRACARLFIEFSAAGV